MADGEADAVQRAHGVCDWLGVDHTVSQTVAQAIADDRARGQTDYQPAIVEWVNAAREVYCPTYGGGRL